MLKVGVVGCGAVVEKFHLPALQNIKNVSIEALVDKELSKVKKLQQRFKAKTVSDDYQRILGKIDMALIALPNFLHAETATKCLKAGVDVFCEKPLAINLKQAKTMIKIAKKNKKKLGVGMVRRFFKVNRGLKQKLAAGELGKIKSFEYEEGFVFNWPVQTNYVFNKKQAGGGVLIDMGSHVLDLIIWLLGKPSTIEYWDDGYRGVEANCRIKLQIGSIKGRIELSRDRGLKNSFKIVGQKGSLELAAGGTGEETFERGIEKELRAFARAVESKSNEYIKGEMLIELIKAIDYCYRHKKQIYEPWFKV